MPWDREDLGLDSKDPVFGLHDNDSSHSEKDFAHPASLESNMSWLDFPPRSLDLNPIENLFGSADARKIKLDAENRPRDATASFARWIAVLEGMSEDGTIMKTCLNVKSRFQECIKNRGGATHY